MTRTEPLPGPGLPGSGSGTQPPAGHGPGTKRFLLMVAGGGLVDCSVGIIGVGGGELHPLRLVMWAILFGWYQVPTLAVALAPSLAAQRRYGSGLRQATTQRLYWKRGSHDGTDNRHLLQRALQPRLGRQRGPRHSGPLRDVAVRPGNQRSPDPPDGQRLEARRRSRGPLPPIRLIRRPATAGRPATAQEPRRHIGCPGPRRRRCLALPRPRYRDQSSAALGRVMSAGTTQASNSSAVTKPSSRADSRSDSPLWWAFLAILEALS